MKYILLLIPILLLSCSKEKSSEKGREPQREKQGLKNPTLPEPALKPALLIYLNIENFNHIKGWGKVSPTLAPMLPDFDSCTLVLLPHEGQMKACVSLQGSPDLVQKLLTDYCTPQDDFFRFSDEYLKQRDCVLHIEHPEAGIYL